MVEPTQPEKVFRDRARSRRARSVRPRTENLRRMSHRQLTMLSAEDLPLDGERPRTRADCAAVERPCPFVGCHHSLFLEVSARNGSIKLRFPDLGPEEMPPESSCVLDVAERGGVSLQEVGDCLNMVRERVRQIQQSGCAAIARAHPELRDLLPETEPPSRSPPELPRLETPRGGLGFGEQIEALEVVGITQREQREDAMTSEKKKKPEGRRFELELACRLKGPEIIEKAELVAKLHEEAHGLRMKKKAATEEIGGEIKGKEGAISVLVGQIRTKSEKRPVECVEEMNFRDGIVQTRRLDTRDVVATRTMAPTERQPSLFEMIPGGKAEPGAGKKKGPRKKTAKATTEPAGVGA